MTRLTRLGKSVNMCPMSSDEATELAALKKRIVKLQLMGMPGAICLGLGLYGLFGTDHGAFHPLLENRQVIVSLLVVGTIIEVWNLRAVLPLVKRKAELQQQEKG